MQRSTSTRSLIATAVWVTLFAVAFAWIESAVVHYLHVHFYPEGFGFPLVEWPQGMLAVEFGREISTVVVLAAVAILAGGSWWRRFAWFMLAFGVWDILYYVWLVLFEGWPQSLLTPDLLFLVPVPWAGPVLAPVLVSLGLILCAVLIVWTEEKRGVFKPGAWTIVTVLAGWAVILTSFMLDSLEIIGSGTTGPYRWEVFAVGMAIWAAALIGLAARSQRKP